MINTVLIKLEVNSGSQHPSGSPGVRVYFLIITPHFMDLEEEKIGYLEITIKYDVRKVFSI